MSDSDVPFLSALAEVGRPRSSDGAGARFLLAAAAQGVGAVPAADAEVWAAWVDLELWQLPDSASGPQDRTGRARADLAAVAVRLGRPEHGDRSRSGLSAEQDARLRTLAALRELGELSPELQQLRRELRERDQRATVRPPSPVAWPSSRAAGGSS